MGFYLPIYHCAQFIKAVCNHIYDDSPSLSKQVHLLKNLSILTSVQIIHPKAIKKSKAVWGDKTDRFCHPLWTLCPERFDLKRSVSCPLGNLRSKFWLLRILKVYNTNTPQVFIKDPVKMFILFLVLVSIVKRL